MTEMSALRRALHLTWELICPFAIVRNSEQGAKQLTKKSASTLVREPVQERKRRTSSEHVELVMARIFSKQRRLRSRDCFDLSIRKMSQKIGRRCVMFPPVRSRNL